MSENKDVIKYKIDSGALVKKSTPASMKRFNEDLNALINQGEVDRLIEGADEAIKKGEYKDAFKILIRAIEINPGRADLYFEMGNLFGIGGKPYLKMLELYNEAIRLDSNYGDAYHMRGLVYLDLGDFNNFRKDILKAMELGTVVNEAYATMAKKNQFRLVSLNELGIDETQIKPIS